MGQRNELVLELLLQLEQSSEFLQATGSMVYLHVKTEWHSVSTRVMQTTIFSPDSHLLPTHPGRHLQCPGVRQTPPFSHGGLQTAVSRQNVTVQSVSWHAMSTKELDEYLNTNLVYMCFHSNS